MIRALLVDDDVGPLEAIREVFEIHGFQVIVSNNGKSGLNEALQSLPDLVLTDWEMPQLDGVSLCRALRGNPRFGGVPLILISGKSPPPDGHLWDVFFKKPVDIRALEEVIRRLKRRRTD
ncbi:PAS/PAC sensor hybrid histidine kinase [Burkholderia sp. 8Y]|uniref:response regulator n=1 Tax=Burkholderia sp. 8Y TaxID=2653133 RepID=UPI0012F30A13|nr:response regulator [Burkholderia sp. 8Y]VXC86032.1 PAS/PAC sensor hybrid histidine kinase [Burkholderia sp. 8Y]